MKRLSKLLLPLIVLTFACGSVSAYAVPAYPKPVTVTLPDGSTLTLHLYGDEFGHYTATSDGYEVTQGADGFYYHVALNGNTAVPTSIRAKEANRRGASDFSALSQVSRPGANNTQRLNIGRAENMARMRVSTATATQQRSPMRADEAGGKSKSVVILVNFKDVKFTTANPRQAVDNLLNQPGYSENGAIGSAWDYYFDNSNGRFDPQFDVFGPYDMTNNMSYYGGNNEARVPDMVVAACKAAAAAGVDFSQYLNDQGNVKDVYVFYAGYAESYGNSSNTIWPHRVADYLGGFNIVSGLTFTGYACSSELMGTPNNDAFTSIGTFCHEYGHVLGWPDFYDTNYATNGSAITFEEYSVMAAGSYNADGNKPPAFMAIERKLMGWLENETPLALNGFRELPDIYTSDSAYILETDNPGEYYLFETRNSENNKWDAGLRNALGTHVKGMLVTHIDRSSSYLSRWNSNELNAYSNHPCARVVKANKSGSTLSGWMFKDTGVSELSGDTHPEFVPWSGTKHEYELRNIAYADGKVTFDTGIEVANVALEYVYQNDAEVSWMDSPHTGAFNVELYSGGALLQSVTTDVQHVYFSLLKPSTSYVVKIIAVYADQSKGSAAEISFTTKATRDAFPSILTDKTTYNSTEAVPLRVVHTSPMLQSVVWDVDGTPVSPPSVVLQSGRHRITVTITNSDGYSEKITKYITVQ